MCIYRIGWHSHHHPTRGGKSAKRCCRCCQQASFDDYTFKNKARNLPTPIQKKELPGSCQQAKLTLKVLNIYYLYTNKV